MRSRAVISVAIVSAVAMGCSGWCGGGGGPTPAPTGGGTAAGPWVPTVFADCFRDSAGLAVTPTTSFTGTYTTASGFVDLSTSGTLTYPGGSGVSFVDTGTAVSGRDPITGQTLTGTVTEVSPATTPKSYTVNITTTTAGGITVTVTGTITVNNPPPCTGSGSWRAVDSAGRQVGSGSWTIP